jgi:lipoate-protein ligase A
MKIHFLHTKDLPILQSLQLEEALLRSDDQNWCLINEGSEKSLVLGISGKPKELINFPLLKAKKIPVIRRFSGGGAVVVNKDTLFVTFIFHQETLPIELFPEPILRWSENFYKNAFSLPNFSLRENDFVLDDKKCGGNAQYIQKNRWLQHTSFLWNYNAKDFNYLLMPPKMPTYRQERKHQDFLCKLQPFFPKKHLFVTSIKTELEKTFSLKEMSLEEVVFLTQKAHRKTTSLLRF